ncbi:MAG: hypothetical protein JWR80_8025 [Bradyrhizobium sp.]|nr:hypothetical protein [Bradyrhizobium sp.]
MHNLDMSTHGVPQILPDQKSAARKPTFTVRGTGIETTFDARTGLMIGCRETGEPIERSKLFED